ncbi:MAG: PKD domain-containing protein, partial [Chitinophagales bacterium]|nr:PKD domain-containing protein [Chitinophagales bacterium]
MKKLFFLSYCGLLLNCCLTAQSVRYFEQVAAWNSNQEGKKIKAVTDSLFIISGNTVNPPLSNEWHSYTVEWSLNGTISTPQEYYYAHNDMSDLVNGQLALTGYFYPDDSTSTYLYLLNVNGDSVSFNNVGTNLCSNWGRCIWSDIDGSFVIGGTAYIGGNKELYCLKVAGDGTVMWEYIDTSYGHTNYFTDILPDGNGGYYLYGSVNQYPYGLVSTGDLLLLHLNAAGQLIDQHTYSIGETDYSGDMLRSSDGGFLLGAAHVGENTDTWGLPEGGVVKINADYSLGWVNDSMYLGSGASSLIELADGSIITTGSTQPPIVNSPMQMGLVKIAADGTPLWSRQYGGQWQDYGYDLALSPDGGFVAVGRKDSTVVQTAFLYIVKTNCMGLLTEPEASFSTTASTTALTASFQNLSQFVYPDSIDGGHFIWDFGDGTVPQIDNAAFVSHTFPAYGTYTVRLTAVVCSDTSVVEQEVGVFPVGIY